MSMLSAYGRFGAASVDVSEYSERENWEEGAEGARMSAGSSDCTGTALYWWSAMGGCGWEGAGAG